MSELTTSLAFVQPGEPVDLTNCDREPIHLLGAVQPVGFLLAVSAQWAIQHASESTRIYLGRPPEDLIGTPLVDLFTGAAIHSIRGRLQTLRHEGVLERLFGVVLREGGESFDLALHYTGKLLIIEAAPCQSEDAIDATAALRSMTNRLAGKDSFADFCSEAALQVRALTGIDRVMVYRFAHDGSGEVIAESVRPGIGSFLGQRYPASDIPVQARKLYERSWLRVIYDIDAEPSVIRPTQTPSGAAIDLSMSVLRAVSPIHIEYLRNMGVAASLSISILRGGRLWGMFACHHYRPLSLPFEHRTAAELFGQIFSLMLESRERELEGRQQGAAREIHDRLMAEVARTGEGFEALSLHLDELVALLDADGAVLLIGDQISLTGDGPDPLTFTALMDHLGEAAVGQVIATHELVLTYPPIAELEGKAAGAMIVPLSRAAGDFLVFFRNEAAHTVSWAGDPNKTVMAGPLGDRLTPRKSFEIWKETVKGQSKPWSNLEKTLAESLRLTLLEVVLRMADQAAEERQKAAQRQELLIGELNHRVRNILGLIRGVITQSKAGATGLEEFAELLGGRIQALARAHDQITRQQWGPGSLRDLILDEAGAYLSTKADRVILSGPDVGVEAQAFSTIALVIHELMTNSAKYGALSDNGRVNIDWSRSAGGDLEIRWSEAGGPPVRPPTRRGFGSTIIEQSIPHDLNGQAEIDYAPTGVRGRFVVPSEFVTDSLGDAPKETPRPNPPAGGVPPHVLLVEDNLIIALDVEDALLGLGVKTVRTAADVVGALALIEAKIPDFAVLDVNLGAAETSLPIADRLGELGVPFAFATGLGESAALPSRFVGRPILSKPYQPSDLRRIFEG